MYYLLCDLHYGIVNSFSGQQINGACYIGNLISH